MEPQPTGTDRQDYLDLSFGRQLILYRIDSGNLETAPRLLLEQFETQAEAGKPSGSIWLRPEDLPGLIEFLTTWLGAFRQAKEWDSSKRPAPYWGNLE